MAKVNVYISTQGEIFTGTQAELCKEYGIKQKNGFKRKSGAVDASGDRWMTEDKLNKQGGEFKKKTLQLGYKKYSYANPKTGFVETYYEGESDVAANYKLAKDYLENGDKNGVKTPDRIAAFKSLIQKVEQEYDILDYKGEVVSTNAGHRYKLVLPTMQETASMVNTSICQDIRFNQGQSSMADKKIAAVHGKLREFLAGEWVLPV